MIAELKLVNPTHVSHHLKESDEMLTVQRDFLWFWPKGFLHCLVSVVVKLHTNCNYFKICIHGHILNPVIHSLLMIIGIFAIIKLLFSRAKS